MSAEHESAVKIFYSYAQEDQSYLLRLDQHLAGLKRSGQIVTSDRRDVLPGDTERDELIARMDDAHVILLLISAYFLHNDECYNIQMQHALEKRRDGLQIIPIILSPVDWQSTPLTELRVLPTNNEAITQWQNQDEAFHDITREITRVVSKINEKRSFKAEQAKTPPIETFRKRYPATDKCYIIPTECEILAKLAPTDIPITNGYRYLGKLDELPTEHLYREKDGHVALLITPPNGLRPYLIDKYAITNQQFCLFLNDLQDQNLAHMDYTTYNGMECCISHDEHVLAIDSLNYWQKALTYKVKQPWGMTRQHNQWQPLNGSALLPATLITWWGAQFYAQWAHNLSFSVSSRTCLPTQQQWRIAALFDPESGKEHSYPWGEAWQHQAVNYAGYWTGIEIYNQADWKRWWAQDSSVYEQTRPLPAADLAESRSAIGCIQILGNVWEWCNEISQDNPSLRLIRGGACNSPQEYCKPDYQATWRQDRVSEYIGFRCAYTL